MHILSIRKLANYVLFYTLSNNVNAEVKISSWNWACVKSSVKICSLYTLFSTWWFLFRKILLDTLCCFYDYFFWVLFPPNKHRHILPKSKRSFDLITRIDSVAQWSITFSWFSDKIFGIARKKLCLSWKIS